MRVSLIIDRVSAAMQWNRVANVCLVAGVVGLSLNLVVYAGILSSDLSHMAAYRELHLGMPRAAVVQILQKNKIGCGTVYSRDTPPLGCEFWDFWRDYKVGFAPGSNGQLEFKSFTYRHRSTSFAAAVRWLDSR